MSLVPRSLALCLDAPMQSWGTRSHGVVRDTSTEPTKSGVVGLLAAACGIPRVKEAAIVALAGLRMGVRVDREGIVERDYQTAQNVPTTLGTGHRTIVSERYYLADALFLVVLEGDANFLTILHAEVQDPVWPLYLGRRAFVPARPLVAGPGPDQLLTGAGLLDASVEMVLEEHPWLETDWQTREQERKRAKGERPSLRTVVDCPPADPLAELRHDHPLSFARGARRFATRTVRTDHVELADGMIATGEPACF